MPPASESTLLTNATAWLFELRSRTSGAAPVAPRLYPCPLRASSDEVSGRSALMQERQSGSFWTTLPDLDRDGRRGHSRCPAARLQMLGPVSTAMSGERPVPATTCVSLPRPEIRRLKTTGSQPVAVIPTVPMAPTPASRGTSGVRLSPMITCASHQRPASRRRMTIVRLTAA